MKGVSPITLRRKYMTPYHLRGKGQIVFGIFGSSNVQLMIILCLWSYVSFQPPFNDGIFEFLFHHSI